MKRSVAFALAIAALGSGGCGSETQPAPTTDASAIPAGSAEAVTQSCINAAGGVLRGTLHGAVSRELTASAANTECRGMPRPHQKGLRLQFRTSAAQPDSSTPLVFILGIDQLGRGDTGLALRTTVTLIDEDNERFFSTGEKQSCFSDIQAHRELEPDRRTALTGTLWCTAAIPQINGQLSVRINELDFDGVVSWPETAQ